jgi:hypothetical protein
LGASARFLSRLAPLVARRLPTSPPMNGSHREAMMKQSSRIKRFAVVGLFSLSLVPLSLSADDRSDWRTIGVQQDLRAGGSGNVRADVVGVVTSVARNGNDFTLRTNRGSVRIEAKGGVPVFYRGQRYRVRDLERGDRVAVDLQNASRNRPRARSIEVIESVRGGGGRYDDRYGSRDPYGNRGGYGNDRYGRYERLDGTVVSLDSRRGQMVVRTGARHDVLVDVRSFERTYGRDWNRSLRRGDRITLEGEYTRGAFVAHRIASGQYGYRR